MKQVKVVVLGAGSAGLAARSEVAKLTDDYVVIDRGPIGTTCARTGCMPSKALIQAANDFHRRHEFDEIGIRGSDKLSVDVAAVFGRVRKLRDRFVGSVIEGMKSWQDKLLMAPAKFIDDRTLDVGGERIEAERIIIATGSRPIIPEAWQDYEEFVLDNSSIFDLNEVPASLAVVGLGVIGLELGQALSRLGVDVHAFDPARSLGGLSSSDLQDKAIELMRREFEITMAPASPVRAANGRLEIEAGDMRCTVDAALLAIGRVPNLGVLAVHNAGLTLNDRGALDIDPATMRVKDKPIYVAGDVTGQKPVLHEAVDEGRIAGYNAVRDDDRAFDRRAQLTITFCDPNIAVVGDGFAALEGKGHRIATGKVDYANQGRATVKAEAAGGAEMYLERSSGRLLGAELLAPDGEHLAHFLAMAVSSGLDLSSILASPFYHPVLEEGLRTALKRAADQLDDELTGLELMRCEEPPVGAET